jgi:hypothetical protein
MMRLLAAVFSAFFALDAWALACASNAAGAWSTAGTWTSCGGGSPGIGDTASITHAVTVSGNTTVGNSPAEGNFVVTVSGSGTVSVNSGTFTARGGVSLATSSNTWTQAAGTGFVSDASNATDPTNQQYEFRIGTGHNSGPRLILNGSSGSRVTMSSQSGGGNFYITDGDNGPWLQGGLITATYADFTRCGDASHRCIRTSPSGAGNAVTIQNSRFDTTGGIGGTYNISTTSDISFTDNWFTATAQSETIKWENASGYTSGTRDFLRNVADKVVQFYTPAGWTIEDNVFNGSIEATTGTWVNFQNNFVRFGTGTGTPFVLQGPTGPGYNYGFNSDSASSNPHYWQVQSTLTVDSLICESAYATNATGEGDCVQFGSPGGAVTIDVTGVLVIPDAFGGTSGTIVSALGNANITANVYRNTHVANTTDEACIALGETYGGHPGMFTRIDSNLCVNLTAGTDGPIAWDSGGNDSVTDLISAANGNRNCHYQIDSVRYVNLELSTGTLGADDTSANPSFVDSSRDLASWAGSIGLSATNAAALTCLNAMNSASATVGCTPSALSTWVTAGFVPRSASLDGAGLSGVDCGAFDVALSTGNKGACLLMGVGK